MSIDEKRKLLALHRLQQAAESLQEAQYLFAGGKSLRSVVNRIYYGRFYAVLALLIYEPYASSKRNGVLAYFNKKFVKDGIFSESLGRSLNKAFELRQRGDYREYFVLTKDQVEPLRDEAAQFVAAVRTYLNENVGLVLQNQDDDG
jgi:uncharacterized protein (UPF0332 family)